MPPRGGDPGFDGSVLLGREAERALLLGLSQEAAAGHGATRVVRGEPGIGRTSLLGDLGDRARAMTVLAAPGLRDESHLRHGALCRLLAPVLDLLEGLPARWREALAPALEPDGDRRGDPSATCAATRALLAAAAARAPLLVLVDDVQWLDAESASALRYSARRLRDDRVLLVAARRDDDRFPADTTFPELRLGGLDAAACGELLRREATGTVADVVARELHRATRGNPLALVELARLLAPAELAGAACLPDPLPVGPGVRRGFGARITALPEATRQALVVAAADATGDVEVVARALDRRGLGVAALEPADADGLVALSAGRVAFAHPLLRAVAYDLGAAPARRRAHAELAAELAAAGVPPGRRARHLVGGALRPSEAVARELDAAAAEARARGSPATAARVAEAAARLSPAPAARARRLLAAALAHHLAGEPRLGLAALDAAGPAAGGDPRAQADACALRARIQGLRVAPHETGELLLRAAARVEPHDRAHAAELVLEAALAALARGRTHEALGLAERARPVAEATGGSLEGRLALVRAAAGSMLGADAPDRRPLPDGPPPLPAHELSILGWTGTLLAAVDLWAGRDGPAQEALERVVGRLRDEGAIGLLPPALAALAFAKYLAGDWRRAEDLAWEGLHLAEEQDQWLACLPAVVVALVGGAQGRGAESRDHLARAWRTADEAGLEPVKMLVGWATAERDLATGEYDDAVAALEAARRCGRACGVEEPSLALWAPDLAEAYLHLGRVGEAQAVLELHDRHAARTGHRGSSAAAARCRGLLPTVTRVDACFAQALALEQSRGRPFERARTLLCFGRRLRREGRRSDARGVLRDARTAFDALGCTPWVEQVERELRATGERARRRVPEASGRLTPQERQVAALIAAGATNREAAAALFVSPRTIETHLTRVYRKLGVRSRLELAVGYGIPRTRAPSG